MNTLKKGKSFLKKAFLISSILAIILLLAAYLFLRIYPFPKLVQQIAKNRTGKVVDIGTISLKGPVIVIRDISIRESDKAWPFVSLPYVGIGVSLSNLLHRSIDMIEIKRPKLFLTIKKQSKLKTSRVKQQIPFSIKKVHIENGEAILRVEDDRSFHISSINLSIEETHAKKAEIVGSAFLKEFNVRVPIEIVLDMERFDIEKGHLDITLRDLEKLSIQNLAFLRDKSIRGSIRIGVDVFKEDRLGIKFNVNFENLNVYGKDKLTLLENGFGELFAILKTSGGNQAIEIEAGGELNHSLFGKENNNEFVLKGGYDIKEQDLKITKASLSSPLFGSLNVEGRLKGFPSKDTDINLLVEGKGIPLNRIKGFSDLTETVDIDGYGKADFIIKGKLKSLLIEGILNLRGREVRKGDINIGPFEASLPFEYKMNTFKVKEALVRIKDVTGKNKDSRHMLSDVELRIPYIEYKDSILRTGNLKLKASRALYSRNGMEYYTDKGISLNSRFTITLPEKAAPHVGGKADLSIGNGGFSSPDGSMAGERIDFRATSIFEFSLTPNTAEFTIHAEASGFELLMGMFYGNFKDKKMEISLNGMYNRDRDSIKLYQTELSLTHMGRILISGEIENLTEKPSFDTEVNLVGLSNREAYDFFLRETFQDTFPILSRLNLEGTTSMALSIRGSADSFTLQGMINVTDMNISDKDLDLSITGINVSLPVDVSHPVPPLAKRQDTLGLKKGREDFQRKGTEHFGTLKIQEISWRDLHVKNLHLFPAIWQNALVFKDGITIPVFGGSIAFANINYDDIFSPKRKLFLSIDIDSFDLDKLTSALEMPRFSGSLSGNIPKATLSGSNLYTEGEIILRLFGGEVEVSNLTINNIFGSITSLKTSIDIKEIDLAKLTDAFEFGHISGVTEGYVKNLVITNGQAESFEASIETVRRRGVKQWISVEALNKISILGSGSSTSILSSGIYRFFKKYRYEKIGFRGSLRNDNFLLLGVEGEGDRQYLVKGGFFPPKVDVINYTQNVSFKEMLERLKRIKHVKR